MLAIKKLYLNRFLRRFCLSLFLCLFLIPINSYSAIYSEQALISLANSEIRKWAQQPVIIDAVKKHNEKFKGISISEMQNINSNWRQELKKRSKPLVRSVISNEAAEYLNFILSRSQGLYTYILITDSNGLAVAQTAVTPDYWHSSYDYWRNTYGRGAQGVFVEEIEFSNITQMFQARVSFTLLDEEGEIIGVVTVGIDVEALS